MGTTSAPIFVVGPARSGTTLVARILGRHSAVFAPGETPFFDDIYSRRSRLGDPENDTARAVILKRLLGLYGRLGFTSDQQRVDRAFAGPDERHRLQMADSYAELLECFMSVQASHEGKRRWCCHVPRDAFNAADIDRCFPNARFVFCLRDPRDYLLSYSLQWRVPQTAESVARLQSLYHPLLTSLLWRSTVRQLPAIERAVGSQRLLRIRYESLVASPRDEVQGLMRFVGEGFEQQQLELDHANSSFDIPESGIYSSSTGRWRNELGADEVFAVQTICRREMRSLGYPAERTTPNPLRLAGIGLTFPLSLARAIRANRGQRGPLIPYLARRFRY